MKHVLIGLVALIGVLAALLAILWDWGWFRGQLEDQAFRTTGRETRIGAVDVDWDWSTPRLVLGDIELANAAWAGDDPMFRAETLSVSIRIWKALSGEVILPEVVITRPEVVLERSAAGAANWDFGGNLAADVAAEALPEDRTEMPEIERLVIDRGTLAYVDPSRGIDLASEISTAVGDADDTVRLEGQGSFEGRPFALALTGGSILALQDAERPYPLLVEATIGDTSGRLEGTLTEPFRLAGMDIVFELTGADMAEIFPILGIPLPPTRPYRLSGRLNRTGEIWSFDDFTGKVGESDLHGDVRIDTAPEPAHLQAELRSDRLEFADLSGFIGAAPPGEDTDELADGRLLPETSVDLERLRAMDMDVHFVAGHVGAPGYALDSMDATLRLDGGLAVVEPLRFGVADGVMAGSLTLDGREATPASVLDMRIEQVAIAEFFSGSEFAREMGGLVEGRVELAGSGASLADMLARGDGRLALVMTEGSISAVLVELSGLDIGEYLALEVTGGDVRVPIDCMAVDFDVADGIGTSRTLLLDTPDSFVAGQGLVNLADESVDLELVSDPKDFSLLSLNAPIYVEGSFVDPAVAVGAEAVVPKIDFGDAEAGSGLCESLKGSLR